MSGSHKITVGFPINFLDYKESKNAKNYDKIIKQFKLDFPENPNFVK